MKFNVTCSTDDNYIQHCTAMLCSLFENNKNNRIYVHLLYNKLSSVSQSIITKLCERYSNQVLFYKVDESNFSNVTIKHEALSLATFYRILLPSILDEKIERILYLDCDVIVLKDISSLFYLNLQEYGVAAVKDSTPWNDEYRQLLGFELKDRAFCAGVLMINLKYWREHYCQQHMLEFANKMSEKLIMEDQDVLNHEFYHKWFELPYKYGKAPMSIAPLDKNQKEGDIIEYAFDPAIIHYSTHIKPWLDIRIPEDKYYWQYVELSHFPNPQKIKASIYHKKLIRETKVRYYINFYVHPFIPDIIEMLINDVIYIIRLIMCCFTPSKMKKFMLERWIQKYK